MTNPWSPGPWIPYEFGGAYWVSNKTDDSGPMLRVGSWFHQREANAVLIAAAPEMADLLQAADRKLVSFYNIARPLGRSGKENTFADQDRQVQTIRNMLIRIKKGTILP